MFNVVDVPVRLHERRKPIHRCPPLNVGVTAALGQHHLLDQLTINTRLPQDLVLIEFPAPFQKKRSFPVPTSFSETSDFPGLRLGLPDFRDFRTSRTSDFQDFRKFQIKTPAADDDCCSSSCSSTGQQQHSSCCFELLLLPPLPVWWTVLLNQQRWLPGVVHPLIKKLITFFKR